MFKAKNLSVSIALYKTKTDALVLCTILKVEERMANYILNIGCIITL